MIKLSGNKCSHVARQIEGFCISYFSPPLLSCESLADRLLQLSFFFFKQKTAYEFLLCDWSSDVCSSDLMLRETKDFVSYFAAFTLVWVAGRAIVCDTVVVCFSFYRVLVYRISLP